MVQLHSSIGKLEEQHIVSKVEDENAASSSTPKMVANKRGKR